MTLIDFLMFSKPVISDSTFRFLSYASLSTFLDSSEGQMFLMFWNTVLLGHESAGGSP